jgi:K+-sensing histidine kinase KdpD
MRIWRQTSVSPRTWQPKWIRLKGRRVGEAVAEFVRQMRVTQVVFGHSKLRGRHNFLRPSAVQRFLQEAPPVDVHIVTPGTRTGKMTRRERGVQVPRTFTVAPA